MVGCASTVVAGAWFAMHGAQRTNPQDRNLEGSIQVNHLPSNSPSLSTSGTSLGLEFPKNAAAGSSDSAVATDTSRAVRLACGHCDGLGALVAITPVVRAPLPL